MSFEPSGIKLINGGGRCSESIDGDQFFGPVGEVVVEEVSLCLLFRRQLFVGKKVEGDP